MLSSTDPTKIASNARIGPGGVNPVDEAFPPLFGRPCWQVSQGHGSFLTMEFGEPHLIVDAPRLRTYTFSSKVRERIPGRLVTVRGDWHLWIYCCAWRLFWQGRLLAHCESSDKRLSRALSLLDGQALTGVEVEPANARSTFTFDLGCKLVTYPDDRDSEQWMLFEPSGFVLTVRADGQFSYARGDAQPELEQWRPLPSC